MPGETTPVYHRYCSRCGKPGIFLYKRYIHKACRDAEKRRQKPASRRFCTKCGHTLTNKNKQEGRSFVCKQCQEKYYDAWIIKNKRFCTKCGRKLTNSNTYPSSIKKGNHICKTCEESIKKKRKYKGKEDVKFRGKEDMKNGVEALLKTLENHEIEDKELLRIIRSKFSKRYNPVDVSITRSLYADPRFDVNYKTRIIRLR